MEKLIKGALASGLSRAQAYELWSKAIELKKAKVFQHLKSLSRNQITWSELENLTRKYQLSQEQYQMLKVQYFAYSWD